MSSFLEIVELSMMNDINKMTLSSHNVSNISTNSYKREVNSAVPFDYYIKYDAENNIPEIKVDSVSLNRTTVDLSSGSVRPTNNPFDFAIQGEGMFVVHTETGISYTRNGSFKLDAQGRLVTKDGYIVEGESGEIRISTTEPKVTRNGEIWDGNQKVARLMIVGFDKPDLQKLQKNETGNYFHTSARPDEVKEAVVLQGYAENSNVKSAYEMIKTIETMRHFELNQKLIHMQQEMFNSSIEALGQF